MKVTYKEQLENLVKGAVNSIGAKVSEHNIPSQFSSQIKCLPIEHIDLQFTLSNDSWLVEVMDDFIVDSNGYQYDYNSLDNEQLFDLVDFINVTY
jgi:hypothetical protein